MLRSQAESVTVRVVDGPEGLPPMESELFEFTLPGSEETITAHAQTTVNLLMEMLGKHRSDRGLRGIAVRPPPPPPRDEDSGVGYVPQPEGEDPGKFEDEGLHLWHRFLVHFGFRDKS